MKTSEHAWKIKLICYAKKINPSHPKQKLKFEKIRVSENFLNMWNSKYSLDILYNYCQMILNNNTIWRFESKVIYKRDYPPQLRELPRSVPTYYRARKEWWHSMWFRVFIWKINRFIWMRFWLGFWIILQILRTLVANRHNILE